ncbi:MxaK protein, putative [Methylophaga frappieri]|uniref:MxaK protein, putative n=1 Tax=Methylophaga frappieri (strain ATCC BAA-2434 / DSM 25690 / JAM7) TaxID=754477 RepID=I1YK10_METFJ|nr:hypothetical protein [Methylophaga frappieri]AFJ03253.1 MxaK protein, putative [Methylophaga frappieri]
MILRRSTLTTVCGFLLLLALGALLWQSFELYQAQRTNKQIRMINQETLPDPARLNMQSAMVRIAYAYKQAELLLVDEAVETYSGTERFADENEKRQIYYNLGNLYLIQAIEMAENLSVDRATAMADVAKDFFRSALVIDPDFWLAKYNYEAAQRLSRDLPLGEARVLEESQEKSDELWSAMPGFPIGLP